MPHTRSALQHTPALDGLRGLAILCVLLSHAGVPLFGGSLIMFVLSGFLITAGLLREYDQSSTLHLKTFYTRRAMRLMPALIVMLASVNLYVLLQRPLDAAPLLIDTAYTLAHLGNWAHLWHTTSHAPILAHLWSLAIEMQFYLLWPPLLWTLRSRSRHALLGVCGLLALVSGLCRGTLVLSGAPLITAYVATPARLDGLFVGAALAVALTLPGYTRLLAWWDAHPLTIRTLAISTGLILIVCLTAYPAREPLTYIVSMPLVSLCAAFIILACLHPAPNGIKALLSLRGLRHLGTISYGVYLWHWPLVVLLQDITPHAGLMGVMGGLIVGQASYTMIEAPLLRRRSNTGLIALHRSPHLLHPHIKH